MKRMRRMVSVIHRIGTSRFDVNDDHLQTELFSSTGLLTDAKYSNIHGF